MSRTVCTSCDLENFNEELFDVEIKPKLGVEKSVTKQNYCKVCECYTIWFMGTGDNTWVEERIQERIHTIRGELNKIIVDINIVQEKQKSIFNFILSPFYSSKIKKLESQKHSKEKYLEFHVSELKDYEQQKIKSNEFYNNLKPKPVPKCLICGNIGLSKDPIIHNCGGQIKYVPYQGSLPNFSSIRDFQFIYDEYGNVKMMERNTNFKRNSNLKRNREEWIESTVSYIERRKTIRDELLKLSLKKMNLPEDYLSKVQKRNL